MKEGVVMKMTLRTTTRKGTPLRHYMSVERGGESTVDDGKVNIGYGKQQALAQRKRHGHKRTVVS
jgi:hypothetical protein